VRAFCSARRPSTAPWCLARGADRLARIEVSETRISLL